MQLAAPIVIVSKINRMSDSPLNCPAAVFIFDCVIGTLLATTREKRTYKQTDQRQQAYQRVNH